MTSEKDPELPAMLITPDGSLAVPPPVSLPPPDDLTEVVKPTEVVFGCEHRGQTFYAVRVYGDNIYLTPPQMETKKLCADCVIASILRRSIRCCLCGRLIRDGNPVALYREEAGFRADARRVDFASQSCLIGCTRCMPGMEFIAGVWQDNHFVSAAEYQANVVGDMILHFGIPVDDDPNNNGNDGRN